MSNVDTILERLRPHLERYLLDGDCTGFEITGRLIDCGGVWKLASKGAWDDDVIRTLQAKAEKERRLTMVR